MPKVNILYPELFQARYVLKGGPRACGFLKKCPKSQGTHQIPKSPMGISKFWPKIPQIPKSPIFCKIWDLGNWGFGDFLLGIFIFTPETPQIPNSPNFLLSLENAGNYWRFWFYTRESPNPQIPNEDFIFHWKIPQFPKSPNFFSFILKSALGIWGFLVGDLGIFHLGILIFSQGTPQIPKSPTPGPPQIHSFDFPPRFLRLVLT